MMSEQEVLQYGNTVEELHTVMLPDKTQSVLVGTSSVIGRRNEQQDAIKADTEYSFMEDDKAIFVLCDGMGGLSGGERASGLCSSIVFDLFHQLEPNVTIPQFYKSVIAQADDEVRLLKREDGVSLNAGTTLASIVIEENHMYWASVGDSRIYIIRGDEILCITQDHNFLMLLNEKVKRGEMTQEEAENNPKKEALVSYIGMGGVNYIDMNNKAFQLLNGDRIVLCSDGLYRSVTEDELKYVVHQYDSDLQATAEALTALAMNKNLRNQDNTSVIVIGYQDVG